MSFSASPLPKPAGRRPALLVAFHWITVLALVAAVTLVLGREAVDEKALRTLLLNLHKSFGLLLLALGVARVALRAALHPLPAAAELPALARFGAAATHGLLYLLLLAVPACGWLLASSLGKPAGFFGLFTLPSLVDIDEDLGDLASELHETGAYLLLALIGLHVAAALHHHFILKDQTLRSMLPGLRQRP